jgi:hypothetical protein
MPEGVGYPNSNVIASAGKELNYTGNFAYAYSGVITVGNETVECLNFITPNRTIIARVNLAYDVVDFTAGEKIGYEMLMNGIIIMNSVYGANLRPTGNMYSIDVIVPPLTHVQFNFVNTDDSGIDMTLSFTGELYK